MTDRSTGPRCGNNPNFQMSSGDRQAVKNAKARLALQKEAQPYIERAAWEDGDPLMEVIASTIWKHCAHDDAEMPQAVCDDPRTIAAFAAAVARAHAATAPAPATDQAAEGCARRPHCDSCDGYPDDTDLTEADIDRMMAEAVPVQIVTAPPATRGPAPATDHAALVKRVAAALQQHGMVHLNDPDLTNEYDCCAEAAIAAVLPAPADRATVLHEAADRFDRHVEQLLDGIGDKAVFVAKALRDQAAVWSEAAETLRRRAAESAPVTGHAGGEAPTPCGPAPSQCDAEAGEPCANHEREQAHAEGEHCFCGPECEQACTCAAAGDAFVPLGHYRDCPQAPEQPAAAQQPICKCPAEICQCGHHKAQQPKEA